MIKVILTTNFSESARNAMCYAVQLFGTENTEYTIMNTLIDAPMGNDGFLSVEKLTDDENAKNMKAEENFLRKVFPGKNLNIKKRSVYGQLVAAINELTREIGAHYVVIGNKEKYDFDAGMLRAKTYELIDRIKCPVLAIPSNREFQVDEGGLIFASDLHTINKPDHLEPIIRLAQLHKVPIMAINIKKPAKVLTPSEEEAGTQLKQIFSEVEHEFHQLEHADVLTGIKKFVDDNGASLLVLLARKQNFIQRMTSQSLTKEMSKLANLPLLILHDY